MCVLSPLTEGSREASVEVMPACCLLVVRKPQAAVEKPEAELPILPRAAGEGFVEPMREQHGTGQGDVRRDEVGERPAMAGLTEAAVMVLPPGPDDQLPECRPGDLRPAVAERSMGVRREP